MILISSLVEFSHSFCASAAPAEETSGRVASAEPEKIVPAAEDNETTRIKHRGNLYFIGRKPLR